MPVARIREVCEPILDIADVVLPSGVELLALSDATEPGDGAARLLARGVELVVLKQGAAGSTLYSRDGVSHIPAFGVDEVEPTGAGDCYDAALVVGLSEGWAADAAALMANACGALATTRMGPMEGTFTREEVFAFMATQGRSLPPPDARAART